MLDHRKCYCSPSPHNWDGCRQGSTAPGIGASCSRTCGAQVAGISRLTDIVTWEGKGPGATLRGLQLQCDVSNMCMVVPCAWLCHVSCLDVICVFCYLLCILDVVACCAMPVV
jgi:hypothetical protein